MKSKSINFNSLTDNLIWIGIALGMLAWILESLIHFFASSEGGFAVQIFPSNGHEIWTRLLVAGMPILFCTYAQFAGKQRDRTEKKLRKERDRAQRFLDVAGVMIVALDREGEVTLINRKGCEILGYEEGEIVGKNWFENFLPERLRGETISVSKKVLAGEIKGTEYYENPVLTKQGGERIISWSNSVLIDEQDNIIGHLFSGEDVTETRLAENEMKLMNSVLVNKNEELIKMQKELQKSEAVLRSIFRAAPTGIGVVTDRIIGWTNSMIHEMTGYMEEELLGKSARMMYPSDGDYEYVGREKYAQIMERGTGTVETRWKRKDGTIIDVLLSSTPISLDDLSAGVTFTALDITNRKRAEDALRESEERFRSLVQTAVSVILSLSPDHRILEFNPEAERLYGWKREDVLGKDYLELFIAEEARDAVAADVKKVLAGEPTKGFENRVLARDGSEHILIWNVNRLLDSKGQPKGIIAVGQDITDRKRMEEALRESEEKYRLLVENIPSVTWVTGEQGKTDFISPNVEKIYGYNQEEICKGGDSIWFGRIHPDDIERVRESFKMLFTKKQKFDVEYRIQRKDGEWIWLHDMAIMAYEKDNVHYAYGLFSDITERKRAEEALRESEERYSLLFENMPIVCFTFDRNGRFLSWNRAAAQVYGYNKEEAIGASAYDLIVTPMTKQVTGQVIERIFSGEFITGSEWQDRNKKGEVGWRMGNAFPLQKADGSVEFGVNLNIDITERKRVEEALRKSESQLRALTSRLSEVEEDERRRLAQELHDKVGQNLTALSINLSVAKSLLPAEVMEKLRGHLDDSTRLLEETTKEIRDVMAELRPPVLDDYGLTAALHWYGEQFSKRTGIPIEVLGEELAPRLPADVEITLFRIAQEALTNTAKHAQASHVNLSVQDEPERLLLTIADNGTGFNPAAVGLQAGEAKWGLITMQERAIALGGQFQVESGPEMGTRIVVDVRR